MKCLNCNENTTNPKFCSRNCAVSFNNKKKSIKKFSCINCEDAYVPKSPKSKYCSHKCQHDYQYKRYIKRWKNGEENGMKGKSGISVHIRKYLFDKYNHKCSKCNWGEANVHSGLIPLEINHIDGTHTNNKETNLELLCPNCHALTPNYKSMNKNSTRTYRYLK